MEFDVTTPYAEKLERALSLTDGARISRASALPPLLRWLVHAGLPVRPLHFMSTLGLLLFLTLGLSALILVFHWLALNVDSSSRVVRRLADLGVAGSVAFGVLAGVLTAIVIRFQALRADLPAWRDL